MRFWKKQLLFFVIMLLIGTIFSGNTLAAQEKKLLEAYYSNIGVFYNGNQVSIDPSQQPFIVKGSTYIPLRALGEAFGKNVRWDGANNKIYVTDTKPAVDQSEINRLKNQLSQKDEKIRQLELELHNLKLQLEDDNDDGVDLTDLEDQLNEDYADFEDIDGEISLSGNEEDIEVVIEVDSDYWDDISNNDKEDFIQDIVDDILDEYEDAEIEGTLEDEDSDEILTFNADSDGDITFNNDTDLDSLEEDLVDSLSDFDDLDVVDINLYGDEDDVEVIAEVDTNDWDGLSSSDREDFVEEIVDGILDEFDEATIIGTIEGDEDSEELATFESDSDGDIEISDQRGLSDLESSLNDDYTTYFSDFDIEVELTGDPEDITFIINVEYDRYSDEWDDLSDSAINSLMDNIYEDIEDEFEDAYIDGYVYDIDNEDVLVEY